MRGKTLAKKSTAKSRQKTNTGGKGGMSGSGVGTGSTSHPEIMSTKDRKAAFEKKRLEALAKQRKKKQKADDTSTAENMVANMTDPKKMR